MKVDYWQQRWQLDEIGFNQSEPNELLQRYFSVLDLKPGDRIFVPLCGKSVDMIWLASQGYQVVGVEVRSIACEDFFNDNNMMADVTTTGNFTVFESEKIMLLAGDFFKLTKESLGKLNAVYDRAALIALPAEMRQRYVDHLTKLLDRDIKMLLITTSYVENAMKGPPFSVDEKEVESLYGAHFSIKQLYNKFIKVVPGHLKAKGLAEADEHVYYLSCTEGDG